MATAFLAEAAVGRYAGWHVECNIFAPDAAVLKIYSQI
ncbi:hypothetical protein FM107_01835 [Sphingobacterium sp. JB170]|nr:hypothetical protein FM107_01835 [Sphingobacterium sp. JB170]